MTDELTETEFSDVLNWLEEERRLYDGQTYEEELLAEAEDRLTMYIQEKYLEKDSDQYDF